MPTNRLFVAIPPSNSALQNITLIQNHLQRKYTDPVIRWIPKDNLHITLHFIGNVEKTDIDTICNLLESTAHNHEEFLLKQEDIALTKSKFWIEFKDSLPFTSLSTEVFTRLEQYRFNNPTYKEQHPHVTLARLPKKHSLKPRVFEDIEISDIKVTEFRLYKSDHNEGTLPTYTCIQTFPLNPTHSPI